jgi:hypothetical protein
MLHLLHSFAHDKGLAGIAEEEHCLGRARGLREWSIEDVLRAPPKHGDERQVLWRDIAKTTESSEAVLQFSLFCRGQFEVMCITANGAQSMITR